MRRSGVFSPPLSMNGSPIRSGRATGRLYSLQSGLGDADAIAEIISQYLFDTISYYDYREDYYHAFLAGLLSGAGYSVNSNRETGTGRADIMLLDRKNRRAAVFEIKRSPDIKHMEEDAEAALLQIRSREYGYDLEGFRTIFFYGASFCRKNALIRA